MKINEIVLQEGLISDLKNWNRRRNVKNRDVFDPDSWYVLHRYLLQHRHYQNAEKLSNYKGLDKLVNPEVITRYMWEWITETLDIIWDSNKVSTGQYRFLKSFSAQLTLHISEDLPREPKRNDLKDSFDLFLSQCEKLSKEPSGEQRREQARLQQRKREDEKHRQDMENMKYTYTKPKHYYSTNSSSTSSSSVPKMAHPNDSYRPRSPIRRPSKLSSIADSKFQKVKRKDED